MIQNYYFFNHYCLFSNFNLRRLTLVFVVPPTKTRRKREKRREESRAEKRREMIAKTLSDCVYQEHSSISKNAFYLLTLLWLFSLGVLEITGKHLQYSRFWNSSSNKSKKVLLSSKIGMLILYTPALIAGISSYGLLPNGPTRFLMLKSAITIHFLKRDIEVYDLFILISMLRYHRNSIRFVGWARCRMIRVADYIYLVVAWGYKFYWIGSWQFLLGDSICLCINDSSCTSYIQ